MFNISNMLNVGGKIELKFEINYRVEMLELILNMLDILKEKKYVYCYSHIRYFVETLSYGKLILNFKNDL